MESYSLSIGRAIDTGWEYAKKHGLIVAVVLLVIWLIELLFEKITGVNFDDTQAKALGEAIARGDMEALSAYANLFQSYTFSSIFSSVLQILIYTGLYNLALGLLSGRLSSVRFNVFSLPLLVYVKFFVLEVLVSIISSISIMLCVIPAFFIIPRIAFAPIYLIDNPNAGVFESIGASWKMTKGNAWSIIGLGLLFLGLYVIGLICCCVGMFFAEATILFIFTAAYYQLRGNLA